MDTRTPEETRGVSLPAWIWIFIVLIGGCVFHIAIHYQYHQVFNLHHIVLAFFLVLNILVNFWELGLYFCRDKVCEEYEATRDRFKGREMTGANQMFVRKIPLLKLFCFSQWTGIWSTYALFDPGYVQRNSFGFIIDVGNGVSTLIPAAIFAFGMTFQILPAPVLGIIGVVVFWQMLYGTILYFFQFFYSRRHVGHSVKNIVLFVGASNGMWFIFPIWGIVVSVGMILKDSYSIFM
jgi:hypothetical protein